MKILNFANLLCFSAIMLLGVYILLLCYAFPVKEKYASQYVSPDYYVDTSMLEDIAWNVSNSNIYSKQYDCTQFSRELVRQLKARNYSAYCVVGAYYNNGTIGEHTWVEVKMGNETIPIEAVGGFVIGQGDYYAHYQSAIKGFCL